MANIATATDFFEIRNFNTKNGLSNFQVNGFAKDKDGFMWIATAYGLNRFDGFEFEVYLKNSVSANGPSGNSINVIKIDNHDRLWIGTTNEGFCYYHLKQKKFFHTVDFLNGDLVKFFERKTISTIEFDTEGKIWLGTFDGLCILDIDNQNLDCIPFDGEGSRSTKNRVIHDIKRLDDGKMLIATLDGLSIYHADKDIFSHVKPSTITGNLKSDHIINITTNYLGKHCISTRGGGLFFLDSADYELSQASFINSDELIWTVEKDKNDLLWIGHGSSMKIYDPKKDKLVDLSIYNLDKPETKVGFYSLYIDDESFVWGGTYSDGFKIFNPYASPFLLINHEAGNANSLSHDIVMSIASLGNNLIAIGTRSGWINIFNLNTKNNKRISTVEKWNYLGDILAICPYGDDMLIGTYLHGLIHCDKDGNKIKQYLAVNSSDKNQLKDNDVRFIKDLGNGQFLVGTNEAGLHLFEPKTGQFEFIEAWPWSGGALKGVFDKSGNLWVASYYGLKRYDASTFVGIDFYTADPQNDNSISKNHITDVHFTRSNLLCLGTFGGGLNLFDIDSETIIKFTENEGFANNIVSSLTEDGNGNLWIGTANGISMLDIDNLQIVNFHEGDGLPASKFNFRSNALIDSAMIVKGTSTGLVVFNPNDILSKSVKASLVITNTIVNNREFIPEIRQRNDSILFDLSLNYDQSDIEFTYAAISYTQAEEIQYQFRLEPVHSNWINQRKNRKITLPALAPGNYTFKLRAQIAPNEFVELRPVLISIKPPLWNTKLFKSAVAFGTIFLFIIIYLWRTHAIRRKNEALKILVDNRTQELSNSHNALTNSYQKIQVQNDEIQAQNEELQSQNEEILSQRDNLAAQHRELGVIKNSLDLANEELQSLNQKLELKVEERTKRLSKVIQDLDRFVYSASHELISPLKSVTGLLNLMEHDKSEINQQKYLQMIGSSIAKLENLVKNLLDYSRNTKADINIEEISLQPFINELLQENEGLNKNVLLINEIPDGVYIKTDVRRLKIVLNNLISNSLKYADLTKNDPFVKVKCDYTDFENYVIYIADNGIGIKKEYQSKLFDMYFRATTKASGSGLGLYISREIISPLGGTIELEASEASGTIFKVVMQKA